MPYVDNSMVAKRCVCGLLPIVRSCPPEHIAYTVECKCATCKVDYVIGTNRWCAIESWNNMIDDLQKRGNV